MLTKSYRGCRSSQAWTLRITTCTIILQQLTITEYPVSGEAIVTSASERVVRVGTRGVRVTVILILRTLIHVIFWGNEQYRMSHIRRHDIMLFHPIMYSVTLTFQTGHPSSKVYTYKTNAANATTFGCVASIHIM